MGEYVENWFDQQRLIWYVLLPVGYSVSYQPLLIKPILFYKQTVNKWLPRQTRCQSLHSWHCRWLLASCCSGSPLKQMRADLNRANHVFALIQEMVLAYCSPFFNAISSARRLWYFKHSWPIPPVFCKY